MKLTLRQMHYAAVLAETGHFGRAAERCFVTQPALSQQIRQLEQICGTTLFDRNGKQVTPTPHGRAFVDRVRSILEQVEALESVLASGDARPGRPLRFGLIPTIAPYLLPRLFPLLEAELAEHQFSISESRTDALVAGMEDGSVDLALIATLPREGTPRLVGEALFVDDFVLATPPGERAGDAVALSDIDRARMLLLDDGHCLRDQALAACGIAPGRARSSFAATSLSTIVEFVANGQGVTLLPSIALGKEATGDRIGIHRLASPGASRTLRLVWREATPYAALYGRVAALIRRLAPATD